MSLKQQTRLQKEQKQEKIIWDTESLSKALEIKFPAGLEISSVAIDSRNIESRALFIGVKGENFNGSDFAAQALEKGAAFCIVDKKLDRVDSDKYIIVSNPLEALVKLAKYARARIKGSIIGVTGSVGKTSTKEMLKIAFENQGEEYASHGNFNNLIGLPLCLANMPEDTEYGILEMGMNTPGELSELSKIATPDISIVTTVEAVHLGHFSSVSAIAAAKSEIFEGMKPDSVAIINMDNPYSQILITKAKAKNLKIMFFGENEAADFAMLECKLEDASTLVAAEFKNKPYHYVLNAKGKHLAMNSLAVLSAVYAAGAELEFAAKNLKKFQAQKGRGQVLNVPKKNITIIDDAYNASPVAVRAALLNLGTYKKNRLIAVLGDMKELGSQEVELHKSLFFDIVNNKIDLVFTVGNLMKHLYEKLPDELRGKHTNNSKEMLAVLEKELKAGDVVLIKGSNSMDMESIVDGLVK
jgi:UDP-N-acetylmuramoyl-tripeptide--D-alanyl-D-alanine ligase